MSELKVNEYDVKLIKVVDGDTCDVDIDLGFGIWLKDERVRTTEDKDGEDMKGKFGRVLGDFRAADGRRVTEIMIAEGHCVPYFGGSKEEVQTQHMVNRERLLTEGVVDKTAYDKAVAIMEKKKK
jgi:hypothetical protein